MEEEYASMSKLLQEFTNIPTIDKAWTFESESGIVASCLFALLFIPLLRLFLKHLVFVLVMMCRRCLHCNVFD